MSTTRGIRKMARESLMKSVNEKRRRDAIRQRLEYLRGELRAEQISTGELIELQSLAEHIAPDDVELLEAAGVAEQEDDLATCVSCGRQETNLSKWNFTNIHEPVCDRCQQPASQQPAGEHSPLPWFIKDGKGVMLGSSGKRDSIFICDRSNTTWIAELPAGEKSEVNARLIVRAVNEREELLGVLRRLSNATSEAFDRGLSMIDNPRLKSALNDARAALHRAEQEGG